MILDNAKQALVRSLSFLFLRNNALTSAAGNAGYGLSCGKTPNLPVTEIEFSFTKMGVYYDISLLEGFNLPVSVCTTICSLSLKDLAALSSRLYPPLQAVL